jgi:hypothetical protein
MLPKRLFKGLVRQEQVQLGLAAGAIRIDWFGSHNSGKAFCYFLRDWMIWLTAVVRSTPS